MSQLKERLEKELLEVRKGKTEGNEEKGATLSLSSLTLFFIYLFFFFFWAGSPASCLSEGTGQQEPSRAPFQVQKENLRAPKLCQAVLILFSHCSAPSASVWIGGSILASLGSFQQLWLSKQE